MTQAIFWALVLSGLIGFIQYYLGEIPGTARLVADPAHAAVFTLTTIAGAWAVLVPAKLLEGRPRSHFFNWLLSVPLGCLVGLCASTLHHLLFVTLPADSVFPGLVSELGPWPLVAADSTTTAVGFAAFFTLLLLVRRGWRQADSLRQARLSFTSVVASALIAWLLPLACRSVSPGGPAGRPRSQLWFNFRQRGCRHPTGPR